MTTIDPRQASSNRRSTERRYSERRLIAHTFGSPDWIAAIQQDYLLWPKHERRRQCRRSIERRKNYRRTSHVGIADRSINRQELHSLLTQEEKQMLNELMDPDL
ncbi:MAG: hypothetical protein methR_P1828 [Methyloprofundus sp.]|nr:MAG: hypothetical protein methR_P1828 [Methyloprofundus sp.]